MHAHKGECAGMPARVSSTQQQCSAPCCPNGTLLKYGDSACQGGLHLCHVTRQLELAELEQLVQLIEAAVPKLR